MCWLHFVPRRLFFFFPPLPQVTHRLLSLRDKLTFLRVVQRDGGLKFNGLLLLQIFGAVGRHWVMLLPLGGALQEGLALEIKKHVMSFFMFVAC